MDRLENKFVSCRMVQYIHYTGIGAKKSGKHTEEEFLALMKKINANAKKTLTNCASYQADKKYRPCLTYKQLEKKHFKKIMRGKSFPKKNEQRTRRLKQVCNSYKRTAKQKCTLDQFVQFVGAQKE